MRQQRARQAFGIGAGGGEGDIAFHGGQAHAVMAGQVKRGGSRILQRGIPDGRQIGNLCGRQASRWARRPRWADPRARSRQAGRIPAPCTGQATHVFGPSNPLLSGSSLMDGQLHREGGAVALFAVHGSRCRHASAPFDERCSAPIPCRRFPGCGLCPRVGSGRKCGTGPPWGCRGHCPIRLKWRPARSESARTRITPPSWVYLLAFSISCTPPATVWRSRRTCRSGR